MNNNEAQTVSPIYSRITTWAYSRHCDEWMANCPDCGYSVCVFCEDGCGECWAPLF